MSRTKIISFVVMICCPAWADSYDEKFPYPKPVYPIRHWPDDIVSVPCSAWRKDDLGKWAMSGTLDWTGGDALVPNAAFFPFTPEGKIIEQKCFQK